MSKDMYRIPASIDRSFLDHEITLNDNWQVKPLPMKVIGFYVIMLLITGYAVMNTFIKDAPWYLIGAFIIWMIIATFYFGAYSKTKEMRFMQIPTVVAYLPKKARNVFTRKVSNPNPFYSIANIKEVTPNGVISFADGTVGQAYLVVGSASILLFDQDKESILDRVDAFWRKVGTDTEYITVTAKEPLRIHSQLANLQRRYDALEVRDPELLDLMEEQRGILVDEVGTSFKSIHQYLILKSDNAEALRSAQAVLKSEVENGNGLMIKQCTSLGRDDVIDMLKVVFSGR